MDLSDIKIATAQAYFRELSEQIFKRLQATEVLLLNYEAEQSDFVRLNHNRIRQAGNVLQQELAINLITGQKQCAASLNLSGSLQADLTQIDTLLLQLREQIPHLPEDPYLHIATEQNNSVHHGENTLPPVQDTLQSIIDNAGKLDLVGIWASGVMMHGFANSHGQFNWHSTYNFNFDWSVYHQNDKAIKQNYAGFEWNNTDFQQKIDQARQTLELLAKPAKTITPGKYRVFLAPDALQELLGILSWGGFGLKSHKTRQTPLLGMVTDNLKLSPKINLTENHAIGLTPVFCTEGFIKPDSVSLIKNGNYDQCLVNARSAKEYNSSVNCNSEYPQSLQLSNGTLQQNKIMSALGTGIYISNLWYCNYSDRNHCRMTGMTRFACLWVENGVPVAPLNVMRFDESIYHILGDKLIDLTEEQEKLFAPDSYHQRSESSAFIPGALVDDFTFTL